MDGKKKDLSQVQLPSELLIRGSRIGLVVAEWNPEVTEALAQGAYQTLVQGGIAEGDILRIDVPGSFELPAGAQMLLNREAPDAIICIGCVIQGETRHFEFISQAVANGIMQLSIDYGVPVIFGVLTTDNQEQALARSGGQHGNKGIEAAAAALNMIAIAESLESE